MLKDLVNEIAQVVTCGAMGVIAGVDLGLSVSLFLSLSLSLYIYIDIYIYISLARSLARARCVSTKTKTNKQVVPLSAMGTYKDNVFLMCF